LGVLVAEAAGHKHDIDFMNPKRRPPKEKPIARYALMAAAAASLLFGGAYLYYSSHWALDAQIAALSQQSKDLDELVQVAQQNTRRWKSVESFVDKEVNWLDELERMSNNLPPASEVIIRDANFTLNNRGKDLATISANGLTKDKDTHKKIEEQLRSPYYKVQPKTSTRILQKIEGLEEYSWAFDGDMVMTTKPPKATAPAPAPVSEPAPEPAQASASEPAPEPVQAPASESVPAANDGDKKATSESSESKAVQPEAEKPAESADTPVLTESSEAGGKDTKSDVAG